MAAEGTPTTVAGVDHLSLLTVHAHPDDESIATGGVLAKASAEGMRAGVVTCTGGELGEIVGEGMDPDAVRPRLGEVRLAELTAALDALGVGPPRMLGYRDSGMVGTPGNDDPASFWRAPLDEAIGRLVREIREFKPTVMVVYDAYGGYGHPDHVQAHRVGLLAVAAAEINALYPEAGPGWHVAKLYETALPKRWIWEATKELTARGMASPFAEVPDAESMPLGTPDEYVTTKVDVSAFVDAKLAAMRAHASQMGPDSFFLNMPEELALQAWGTEFFRLARSDVPTPVPEDDLFAGLV